VTDKLPPRILVVETNNSRLISLFNVIERSWFSISRAGSVEKAITAATNNRPDILVIDSQINLEGAIFIANKIRHMNKAIKLPLIFMLEKGEATANYVLEDNNLVGFIYKPFTSNQLMEQIRSMLRRSQTILQDKVIKYKNVRMDLTTYAVYEGNRQVHLGPTEFKILQLFIQSPFKIFSRQKIIEYIWDADKVIDQRTVDVHINRIRKALSNNNISASETTPFIKTIRSSGYCLALPDENPTIA